MGRAPFQFEGDFAAVAQEEYKRRARDPRFDYRHRVEYAAMGWANQIGHAEFPPGELNKILADKDGTVPSKDAVNNHVRRAKDWDLVETESNRRCLVLPEDRFQKGIGDRTCDEHGIRPAKRFRP
ncbi:hypothetical protein [Streptomyces hesseae]|uniref:MarR family transcriptional regulator n=1 Tax=Streptomyces hesseae TaxID=3075519 RepID=A0ABU2STW2_9ACTN|nr:hypothetical protein [Streptomyces sp. DSM 40473]MDT0451275.1 hypothetical protein [Streptomyces sp. DSM 40473]